MEVNGASREGRVVEGDDKLVLRWRCGAEEDWVLNDSSDHSTYSSSFSISTQEIERWV